jgi:SpoIID/LytB domain protein
MKEWKEWVLPVEIPIASSSVTIRVGLATHVTDLLMRSPSEIQVFAPTIIGPSPTPTPLAILPTGKDYQLVYLPAKRSVTHHEIWLIKNKRGKTVFRFTEAVWLMTKDAHQPLVLHDIPSNKGYFFGKDEDRAYREIIEILPREKIGFNVINRVSFEAYTAGVLPSEMISSWPLEALKAQAIAARSYVLTKLDGYKNEGFDVADGVQSQVYGGVGAETRKTDSAVNQTAGMVLKSGGKVIPAVFSAQCGGHTQDYEEAWGIGEPIVGVPDYDSKYNQDIEFPLSPYRLEVWIKGDPVSYCRAYGMRGYRNFRWVTEVPEKTILLKVPNVGRIRRLAVTHRSSAGWADRLVVEGDKGSQEFKGDSIRSFFGGIRSNLIWIEPQFNLKGWPEEFIIYGGGWGHGVGMCQVGCYGLARAGKDCGEILNHYFPKGSVEKLGP